MKVQRIMLSLVAIVFFSADIDAQYSYSDTEIYREVEADVRFLASDLLEGRSTGERGEALAAEYIATRMAALGLKPAGEDNSWFQTFSVEANNPHQMEVTDGGDGSINATNVIGMVDNGADRIIVIGAHYDHLGYGEFFGSLNAGEPAIHNGADDNASGVAAMLQLAESGIGDKNANYLIIGFSGEERGLWGSNYFVKNPTIDLENVAYMINLDMVGRLKTDERKISINGVGTSPVWMEAIEKVKVDGLVPVTTASGVGGSDHTSFYFEGIPAVHFFSGQHEDYHKPSDDADLVNYDGIVSIVNYIEKLIDVIGKKDMPFTQTVNQNEPSARDFKVTLGVMPDYLYTEGGMRIDGVRPDRPAQIAGIEKGDIVIQMGDISVDTMEDYMKALGAFEKGQEVMVKIKRNGEIMEKKVVF